MERHIIINKLGTILMFCLTMGYEEYIMLPENSDYCSAYPLFRRFSLSGQMSFTSGVYNDSWNHLIYVCKVRVHPNGRLLQYTYPQGTTNFWFHRLKVDIHFNSCSDYLTIGFIPEEFTQHGLLEQNVTLTCRETYPKIFDSKHRIISLAWHTDKGSTEEVSSDLDIQMSSYMRFEGNFRIADKMRRCESGSGFWCGNQTAVCIYGQMRCDQADGCFDGGTDEVGCPPPRNYSSIPEPRREASWPAFLPWTALCLIPLVLILVLGLICTPRKASLDDVDTFDDEDENNAGMTYKEKKRRTTGTSSSIDSSECDSVHSIHSAIYSSELPVMTQPHHLPRASSNPILVPMDSNCSMADVCSQCQVTWIPTVCDEPDIPSKSSLSKVRTSLNKFNHKVVTFRVPSSRSGKNGRSATSRIYTKLLTGSDQLDPLLSKNHRKHSNERIVIPAEFEMAALNVSDKIVTANQPKICHHPTSETVSSHPLQQNRVHGRRTTTSDVKDSSDHSTTQDTLLTASNMSYSSDDSDDREDVTPFRRPDYIGRDVLSSGIQHQNGSVSSTTIKGANPKLNASSMQPASELRKSSHVTRATNKSDYFLL